MKTGANKTDQIKIKKMHADKKSVSTISKALGIEEKAVDAFVNPPKKEEKKENK